MVFAPRATSVRDSPEIEIGRRPTAEGEEEHDCPTERIQCYTLNGLPDILSIFCFTFGNRAKFPNIICSKNFLQGVHRSFDKAAELLSG